MENNYECGKRQSKAASITSLQTLSKSEMVYILCSKYNIAKKDVIKLKREELCSRLFKNKYTKDFYYSPLRNNCNSCYIDAALVALFHPIVTMGVSNFWYNRIFKEDNNTPHHINHIRVELKKVVLNIHTSFKEGNGGYGGYGGYGENGMKCGSVSKLRKLFASYKSDIHGLPDTWNQTQQNEWLHAQMDPIDVIGMLEHTFKIPNRNVFSMGYFKNGKPKKDERVGLMGYSILPYMLQNKNKLSDFFPIYIDENVDRRLKKSKFLYVHVYRNLNGVKTTKPFIAPMEISDMYLVSVIIHIGSGVESGHYVSMLKIGKDQWVFYDDMSEKMEVFFQSDLYKASKIGDVIKTSGVGFLYCSK